MGTPLKRECVILDNVESPTPCQDDVSIHIVQGPDDVSIRTASYCGLSFCSWEHLAEWAAVEAAKVDAWT